MLPILANIDLSHAATEVASGVDVNQIATLSGGNPLMVVVLGAVAILGGKTLWDFLKKRQELQHEQKLEEIKANKEMASTGHEQCVAKQQDLETHVTSLKTKINSLEKKATEVEQRSEEIIKANLDSIETVNTSLKKIKKKVKKLEEIAEETENSKRGKQ